MFLYKTKKQNKSIQRQYILVALILGFIVIALSVQVSLKEISNTNNYTNKVKTVSESLKSIGTIRTYLSTLQKNIDRYMLEPDRFQEDSFLISDVHQARQHLENLKDDVLQYNLENQVLFDSLITNMDVLVRHISELKETRLVANKQFPALGVSADVMRPARNDITRTFNTITNEMIENEQYIENMEVFNSIIYLHKMWLRTISEYRLYLANRLGSFEEQGLLEQEDLIKTYLTYLIEKASELAELSENAEIFGFEGSEAIVNLPPNIRKWQEGFLMVQKINHSDNWRQDTKIMKDRILPVQSEVIRYLDQIDNELQSLSNKDLERLNQSGENLILVLVAVITLFTIYIFASLVSLKSLVIKPISQISSVLKNGVVGKINFEELKIIGTKETQDLIDAFTDMSHQVYMRQQELEKQALSDSLTGLPNRLMIMDRLDYQLRISTRDNKKFILMMLDLNHFKEVNDTLGHHIGDELLIQVGKRLQEIIRETDTVARLGGDEFAILLPNVDKENVEIVAKKIDQAIQTTFVVHSYNLNISTSIGITEFPTDATEVNVLMQHADVAMYCAKRNKINYCYYDANVDDYSLDRLALSSDIKKAMNNDELELFYQPKYTIASGELNGVEALLRWDHPSMGYISPEIIVDTAEKVGLIDDLTIWIIGKVAADFDVLVNHTDSINFSINLAVQNLRNENFHTLTSDIINKAKIPPGLITLEVTESGMMINPEQSIDILNQLQGVGFNISIDDFGTGFSSLSYIKKLPVSELKIDKSFVIDMLTDESDRVIVRSTIQLAHNLGLQVVAEGVENRESWDMLRAMECDIAQGYFMCKPMPLNALINHISKAPSFNQLTA